MGISLGVLINLKFDCIFLFTWQFRGIFMLPRALKEGNYV